MIKKIVDKAHTNENIRGFTLKYNISKDYIHISRQMVANAVVVGLFIAMIPIPFQMLMVLLVMPFKKFNVPIALLICWITNPLTMPFIYYMEYYTGSLFLGSEIVNVKISFEWIKANIDNIFIPLYLGAFFYSIVFSTIGYFMTNYLWKLSVYSEKKLHYKERITKKLEAAAKLSSKMMKKNKKK